MIQLKIFVTSEWQNMATRPDTFLNVKIASKVTEWRASEKLYYNQNI